MNVYKDQTFCPKCHRMYCEGYWGEGVCTADMAFSRDPTSQGDEIADYVRRWYELHRETWWERHWPHGTNRKHGSALADEFMLSFINEIARVSAAAGAKRESWYEQITIAQLADAFKVSELRAKTAIEQLGFLYRSYAG